MKYLKLFENYNGYDIYYHGTPDGDLTGKQGIHVGTKLAATEAIEARIGIPAEGEWDGTREYSKTLLSGRKTLSKPKNKWKGTGYNCGSDIPEEDYYAGDREYKAKYSDGSEVPLDCKPIIFSVQIVGRMTNSPNNPHSDDKANSMMLRNIRMGNAKSGYFYTNISEDEGSISAVVPDKSFLMY